MGIGVQGLADAFILMDLPFDSPGARQLNQEIFETIYFASLEVSPAKAFVSLLGPAMASDAAPLFRSHRHPVSLQRRRGPTRASTGPRYLRANFNLTSGAWTRISSAAAGTGRGCGSVS